MVSVSNIRERKRATPSNYDVVFWNYIKTTISSKYLHVELRQRVCRIKEKSIRLRLGTIP